MKTASSGALFAIASHKFILDANQVVSGQRQSNTFASYGVITLRVVSAVGGPEATFTLAYHLDRCPRHD